MALQRYYGKAWHQSRFLHRNRACVHPVHRAPSNLEPEARCLARQKQFVVSLIGLTFICNILIAMKAAVGTPAAARAGNARPRASVIAAAANDVPTGALLMIDNVTSP